MRNNILINRRNKLIYEAYAELWGKGIREKLIWPELTLKFHLKEETLYRIVLTQSRIKSDSQLTLPLEAGDNAA
jgi:hypothetical protein